MMLSQSNQTFDVVVVGGGTAGSGVAASLLQRNKHSLQHTRYNNIFSLGDVCSTPSAKTMAAARKQVVVAAENLLALRAGQTMPSRYDGYGSCPLTVEKGK